MPLWPHGRLMLRHPGDHGLGNIRYGWARINEWLDLMTTYIGKYPPEGKNN